MSIRWRLTVWYTGMLGIMLVLFGLSLYGTVSFSLHREVDGTLQSLARQIQDTFQAVFAAQRDPEVWMNQTVIFPSLKSFSNPDIYIQLVGIDGRVYYASPNLGAERLPWSDDILARAYRHQSTINTWENRSVRLRVYSAPLFGDGVVLAVLQAATSLASVDTTLARLSTLLILSIAGTLILSAGLGAFLARRALALVDRVTQAAVHITHAEDLHRRLAVPGTADEIGRLVAAFNEMLDRLEQVFRSQQRFVADVSHELRTPLTAIRGNLDLLKIGAVEAPEDRKTTLAAIEGEVARLSRLVNDLLFLARTDTAESLVAQPVEMDTLLLDVFRQAQVLADGISLTLGHEDQASVEGDPDRLRQLFLNLVDNALKYNRPGGQVTLSLYREGNWVKVVVEDTGIGIPAEAIPHLFERFYRVDKARSRGQGGTGLGLAIAKEVTDSHGGHIEVESAEGKGSRFTVWLPFSTVTERS